MNLSDIFTPNAFTAVTMTEAINNMPVTQGMLGAENQFPFQGIDTTTVTVEYKQNLITLLPFGVRGTLGPGQAEPGRIVRAYPVPHIPHTTPIMAHELLNVRKFGGGPDDLEQFQERLDAEVASHKANHEATFEFLRAKALCGLLADPSTGVTVSNFYTDFGLTEEVFTFDFTAGTEGALHLKAMDVKKAVGLAYGGPGVIGVGALIDDTFFGNMIKSPGVRSAWEVGAAQRVAGSDPNTEVFQWGGISWKRYNSAIGGQNFFGGTNVARFYPILPQLYKHYGAPGNFTEAVGTVGLPMYSKVKVMDFDMGVQVHSQSNPFFFCTKPGCLKKGTST